MTAFHPHRDVLIIDDDSKFANVMSKLLWAQHRITCETCCQPLEAAGFLQKYSPRVVVLDFEMPHKNGQEVYRELRKLGYRGQVLFYTGSDEELESLGSLSGVPAISKRLPFTHIIDRISRLLTPQPALAA